MPSVTLNKGINTHPTTVAGGVWDPSLKIVDMQKFVSQVNNSETPFQKAIGFGAPIYQRDPKIGQKYRVDRESTVATAIDGSGSTTSLILPTGHGVRFSQYDELMIVNYSTTNPGQLDYTTKENVTVDVSPTGDTVTVTRGFGNTSPLAHPAGAFVLKIGEAMPQYRNFALTPTRRGDVQTFGVKRFQQKAGADKAARKMPTYEELDPLAADIKEKSKILGIDLELSLWHGTYSPGNGAGEGESFAGVDELILSGNRTGLGGALLTYRTFQKVLGDYWSAYGSRVKDVSLWMDYDTAQIIDTFMTPVRQATLSDTTYQNEVMAIKTRFGTFKIMPSHYVPAGKIYGIVESDLSIRPFADHGFKQYPITTDGPYDEVAIWGEYSLLMQSRHTHFVLEGFNRNPDSYPTSLS